MMKAPWYIRLIDTLIASTFLRKKERSALVDWRFQKDYFWGCFMSSTGPLLILYTFVGDVLYWQLQSGTSSNMAMESFWVGLALLATLSALTASLSFSSVLVGRDIELENRLQKLADGEKLDDHERDFRREDVAHSSKLAHLLVEISDQQEQD